VVASGAQKQRERSESERRDGKFRERTVGLGVVEYGDEHPAFIEKIVLIKRRKGVLYCARVL
jgi:hypothetical protein